MSACNERPPAGHPFHGTGVACHLAADHLIFGEAHSWDIEAVAARHELLTRALEQLRAAFPDRPIERFDSQLPHPLAVYDVDPATGHRTPDPHRRWDLPAGPWLVLTFAGGEQYAIWKATGAVYAVGPDGAVDGDPIIEPDAADR